MLNWLTSPIFFYNGVITVIESLLYFGPEKRINIIVKIIINAMCRMSPWEQLMADSFGRTIFVALTKDGSLTTP